MSAQVAWLPDGRLHLQQGPIDLICQAWGDEAAAYARAIARFEGLLTELVAELPSLRGVDADLRGPIARVMAAAVLPYRPLFITPMAAVAGAVAEAVLAAMVGPGVLRAYVNNGGDIALYLTPGTTLRCAVAGMRTGTGAMVDVGFGDPVRGIATSGWRGRSWSLGIADCVTVLAKTASQADAAATMIANAVDLPGHPGIVQRPAVDLQADSDLGGRLVTVAVAGLTAADVDRALGHGMVAAAEYRARGLIDSAALFLHPEVRTLGTIALKEPEFV